MLYDKSINVGLHASIILAGFVLTLSASLACAQTSQTEPTTRCEVTVTSDDAYKFKPAHIDVAQDCKDFTVKLMHVGRLPKAAMGHNWVLVKKTDMTGVATDGMAAGAQHDYIEPGDKRVIAATSVIGGGQTTQVTFKLSLLQPNETYAFLCTFGGHSPLMQGSLRLISAQ
jgi:azurin